MGVGVAASTSVTSRAGSATGGRAAAPRRAPAVLPARRRTRTAHRCRQVPRRASSGRRVRSCAGLAFPAPTALESSVNRIGWYQAVPSIPAGRSEEHVGHALDRAESRRLGPSRAGPRESASCPRGPGPRPGSAASFGVEPVAVRASFVAGTGGVQDRGQERQPCASDRSFGADLREPGAHEVEQAGERRGDPAERQPGIPPQSSSAAVPARRDRRGSASAVYEHQPGEIVAAGLAVEVPGRIRGRDRAAQRVSAQHDLAALLRASSTTRFTSSTATRMPHPRAYPKPGSAQVDRGFVGVMSQPR